MERMFRSGLIVILVFCVYPLSVCQGDDSSGKAQNIVLTPADQLILDAIDKVNGRIDDRYEKKGQDYPIGYVRWTEQRNFEAVLGMMATGRLDVEPLITDRVAFEDAEKAYTKISDDPSVLGVILEYPSVLAADERRLTQIEKNVSRKDAKTQRKEEYLQISKKTIRVHPRSSAVDSKAVVAMIGAGNFAKMTMGPALAKTGARLKYVSARTNGAAASHIARKYGFENATTDLDAIWNDSDVNTVFITTGHNSHAALVCRALEVGKHVFVEKPLCLTLEELERIRGQRTEDRGQRVDNSTGSSVIRRLSSVT